MAETIEQMRMLGWPSTAINRIAELETALTRRTHLLRLASEALAGADSARLQLKANIDAELEKG